MAIKTYIEELIEQLEQAGGGWLGQSQREVTARALAAETGQDLGEDAAAWRRWWRLMNEAAPSPAALVPMSEDRARAKKALAEMGLLDEEEFESWQHGFEGLATDLSHYLRNRSGPALWLPPMQDSYPKEADACRRFEVDIRRLLGPGVEVRLERLPGRNPAWDLTLDGGCIRIDGDPRIGFHRAILRWFRCNAADRQLVLDDTDHLRLLTVGQFEAIRRHGALDLRLLHPEEPGRPHPDVARALERLEAIGLEVDVPESDLAYWIRQPASPGPGRRTIEVEVIDLMEPGLTLDGSDYGVEDLGPLVSKLSGMLDQDLSGGEWPELVGELGDTIAGLVDRVNARLAEAGSVWRLVAMRARFGDLRLFPVPADRVARLAELVPLEAGDRAGEAPPSGPRRFRLARVPPVDQVVDPSRVLVFDAESVDDAESYVPLVQDLLGLSAGAVSASSIACTEHAGERTLAIEVAGKVSKGKLAGDTDWVDLGPLLRLLNRAAKACGAQRRFVVVREPRWGQEAGVAYVSAEEVRALDRCGLLDR